MRTRMLLSIGVLFAAGLLMAQGRSDRPGTVSGSRAEGDVTIQGCLGLSVGEFVLMQTDPDTTYKIEKGSRKLKLDPYLGQQVEVTGWESASLSTSSEALARTSGSSVTLKVTSIRTLASRCTAGAVTISPATAPFSGAQLQISSSPSGADIEIDGKFVGNTPSSVNVGAGEHQLVIKKRGCKPWERTILISSGIVTLDANLETASE